MFVQRRTTFNKSRRQCVLLAAVFILSGCIKVGPDFHRPDVAVPSDWTEAEGGQGNTGPADYRSWWQVFNDPILDRLIDHAYRENLTLRVAGARVLEARALLGIVVGEYFPQTQQGFGSVHYNRTSQGSVQAGTQQSSASQSSASPGGGSGLSFWQSQIGLTASWELDFWGKFRRAIESADAGWLASVADYDNALVALTADVANSYITVRTLEKRLDIARRNAQTQKENLNIAEARFKYGTATQLDLEQAETSLNNTLAAIPSLEAQLRQTKHGLSVLLGMAPGDLTDYLNGPAHIPVSPPQIVLGIPADLLRRRPDIRAAEHRAAAQSAQIGVAKADLYPAFSLSGTFGFLSTDIGSSSLSDMFNWSSRFIQAGPSFQWNILNYGRISNNVRLQDARLQELLIAYQNMVLTAQQEVEDNLVAFLRARDRAEFLARSTAAAARSLDLAVLQYQQGIKDFTTVLIAQQSLLNEQDTLATTMGNIASSLVGVYRALGGGWEIREGKELVPPEIREEMEQRTDWGKLLAPASYNPPAPPEREPAGRWPDW